MNLPVPLENSKAPAPAINGEMWDQFFSRESLQLRAPNALSLKDAKRVVQIACEKLPDDKPLAFAITGLTPALRAACNAEPRITKVYLVDQAHIEIVPRSKETHVQANWLDFPLSDLDAVVGDESINNLAADQYPVFFNSIKQSLRPSGVLGLRILGRYDGSDVFENASVSELIDTIKQFDKSSYVERQGKILQYQASANIAYDPARQLIDTKSYCDLLARLVVSGDITHGQRDRWMPMDKDTAPIQVTCLTPEDIRKTSFQEFRQVTFEPVDQSYCGKDGKLNMLYRLANFSNCPAL